MGPLLYSAQEVVFFAAVMAALSLATFVVVAWGVHKSRRHRMVCLWFLVLAVAAAANAVLSARRAVGWLTSEDYRAWIEGEYRAHVTRQENP